MPAATRRNRSVSRVAALPRYVVIMAGGQGTRFWPRSRRRVPKQLLAITGRRSLLQETARRLRPLFSWSHMLVVTTADHAAAVRRQLPRIPAAQILVEPMGRNTLPCIALAAEWIAARGGDALMAVVPADHVIKDSRGLRATLAAALQLAARRACLVTIGIRPTRAETGYGYVESGPSIAADAGAAHWVRRFHEKPSAAVAKRYAASGRHLWNSGMFVWRVSVFAAAAQRCVPAVQAALHGIWQTRAGLAQRVRRVYRRLPSVSVDVAIMQPIAGGRGTPRVAVVPAAFDWSDVGSWAAVPEVWGCDADGNAVLGKIVSIDTADSIIYSPDRLVALVGINDLIVVDSPDALLICRRDRAQDVRKITEALRARRWSRYL